MSGNGLPTEIIESHTEYKFVGQARQFVIGIPARDLTAADLLEIAEREGITRADVEASGLYEPVDLAEVGPFCGAPLEDGGRCRTPVGAWGERCGEHRVAGLADRVSGIGPETERTLARFGVVTLEDLAALDGSMVVEIADGIPRVSARMVFEWRKQARRLLDGSESIS